MPFFSRPSAIEMNTLGVEHAPGEIDAAGAILTVAMRALLLQEKRVTAAITFGSLRFGIS
jgi:hypothetical protein